MYSAIYLIDDFEMVNLLHRILFRRLGLEEKIKEFTNPEKAMEDLRNNSKEQLPILVLLDINMPEMSGFEFLDKMVGDSIRSNIDVIMVTSSISDSDRSLAKKYTPLVRDFVTKPLQLEKLQNIIASGQKIKKLGIL